MTVLLEREGELAELRAGIEAAAAGRGGATAIAAKAGLGKTHLLQEARRAGGSAGLKVLTARATELEREFPFALVRQLFEATLRGLGDAQREEVLAGAAPARGALGLDRDSDHDTFAVLHGVYWVTAALAGQAPLLLAVDDVHWADPASLDFFGFLLPRLEELSVLLVMTCRVDEVDKPPGLDQLLADSSIRHLSPGPLSPEATARLLTRELGQEPDGEFARTCHEVSGGNPYLLTELARTLAEQGVEPGAERVEMLRELAPEGVARLVLARLGRLPADAAKVARAVAVLGDDCDYRLVAELADMDAEAVRRAADLLRASGIFDTDALPRFAHPLMRNAIYADIPNGERAQAHSRAAAALRARNASPERIATQLLASEGRGDREAVETLIKAAERSVAAGAPRSAITYLSRALQEPPPAELRPAVLDPLIIASLGVADQAAWAEVEGDVLAELERDPSLRLGWASPLSVILALGGRFEEAGSMLRDAIEVAVAEGDIERAFQFEVQLRTIGVVVPSMPEVDLTRYAGRIAPDSPAGRLAAAMEAGSAMVNGTAGEAAEAAKHAIEDDALFLEELDLLAITMVVITLVFADELDAARKAVERALILAEKSNGTPHLMRAWFCRGIVAWAAGNFVAAEADMRQVLDLSRLAGSSPMVLINMAHLIEILIERDELEEAEAAFRSVGMETGPIPESLVFLFLLLMRSHLRFEQGDMEGVAEDFVAIAEQGENLGIGYAPAAIASPWGARALVAVGEHERARETADRTMAFVQRWGAASLVAHGTRALAAARGGEEEIELLEEAAAMAEGSFGDVERIHVLLELGQALRRAGQRVEARAPLREALKLARRCGALRAAKRARDELEATGETVRRFAPIGVESLTPSERRVAELAASGLTNREIAQTLFVTVKTVEAHLSAAYDKLDIDSRRKLGAALASSDGFGAEGA